MIRRPTGLAVTASVAVLVIAACSLDNQIIGVGSAPSGGTQFAVTANIGTSLSAGFQSGGINDSTQREGPMFQLALGMGLKPGVNWFYPSFGSWGCPPPLTDPIANKRVGGQSAAFCGLRTASSAQPYVSNTGIPGLRAAQAIDLTVIPTSADTLKLSQFITGSINPVTMVLRQHPTFVTIEVGANDVLAAATRGDTTFLTPAATFSTIIGQIRDSLATLGANLQGVAIAGVPNVTVIPHFTKASTLYCLKTGACPGVPATLPYSLASFTVDASCAPTGFPGSPVGDSYLLTFPATGAITGVLAAGRLAKLDCVHDSALVAIAAAPALPVASAGATINATEYVTITGRVLAFNTAIQALATTQGWAYVDLNAAIAAQAVLGNIPALPNFANPLAVFACPAPGCPTGTISVFSQDGVHPTKAGYRIMAIAFQAAINTKYSTAIAVP